nr:MAG TPA: hypothetical protein [Caudoviricetes sp.]
MALHIFYLLVSFFGFCVILSFGKEVLKNDL